jgi:POT family proton-dependent oligopeptide transporter
VSAFELAERFSYFGMLAILIYYMYFPSDKGGIGLGQAEAAALVGAYSGAIYLAMVLGGWVADRIFGTANTLAIGAGIVLAGHVTLAFVPGFSGLLVGMLLIAAGSGCTKATTASLVGSFYAPGDAQRIVGFTIFYLSLNLGALTGGIATGFLQQSLGFHAGFGAAAVGMLIGLVIYIPGRSKLPEASRVVPNPATPSALMRCGGIIAVLTVALWSGFALGILHVGDASTIVAVVAIISAGSYLTLMGRSKAVTSAEFHSVVRYIPIFVASVMQVMLWMQLYTVVAVHAEARTDRSFFGFDLPPSTAVASGGLFAIILTPVVNALWTKLGTRQPSIAVKYAISLGTLGLCFITLSVSSLVPGSLIPISLLLGVIGVFYLADLIASPAGLSYATATAPKAFRSQMVALHSMSYAVGAALAGVFAQFYNPTGDASGYFLMAAIVSAAIAAVLVMVRKVVRDGTSLDAAVPA